jgi:uncharacterized coiled-coil protein SlyX
VRSRFFLDIAHDFDNPGNPLDAVTQDSDLDIIAREMQDHRARLETIETRLHEVERVNARLEAAALTTARSMAEISRHWDALYEAMRRVEEDTAQRENP